ncbi:hypothetical protein FUAX_40080 (plasmid) [Fulvitalea axinellae]|uniref:T9SS type A sorting domain-containing protein n=1 Tax=Fulvitalea axinellae TaxID=1182444 RepID=A0AAU9DED2_9BACT|nr:hypothetical protein FUAX_40080 [Fulvitalea axinellae]
MSFAQTHLPAYFSAFEDGMLDGWTSSPLQTRRGSADQVGRRFMLFKNQDDFLSYSFEGSAASISFKYRSYGKWRRNQLLVYESKDGKNWRTVRRVVSGDKKWRGSGELPLRKESRFVKIMFDKDQNPVGIDAVHIKERKRELPEVWLEVSPTQLKEKQEPSFFLAVKTSVPVSETSWVSLTYDGLTEDDFGAHQFPKLVYMQRGESDRRFVLKIKDDDKKEGNKRCTFRIFAHSDNLRRGVQASREITVIDDDSVSLRHISIKNRIQPFGAVRAGEVSDAQFYVVSARGLNKPLEVVAPEHFQLGLSAKGRFFSKVSLRPVDGRVAGTRIYVRFTPKIPVAGRIEARIEHRTESESESVPLSAVALDAREVMLKEDFSEGIFPKGWESYNESGQGHWGISERKNGFGMVMKGANKSERDWLISPEVDLDAYEYEMLTFLTGDTFDPNNQEVWFSNDGITSLSGKVWTKLKTDQVVPADSGMLKVSLDLSAYRGKARLAFVGSGNSPEDFIIEEVLLKGTNKPNFGGKKNTVPRQITKLAFVERGAKGRPISYRFKTNDTGFVELEANGPFEVSEDGRSWNKALLVHVSEATSGKIRVRFAPEKDYYDPVMGSIRHTTDRAGSVYVALESEPNPLKWNDTHLETVTWQFGDVLTEMAEPKKRRALDRIASYLDKLEADVIALQHVPGQEAFDYLVEKMNKVGGKKKYGGKLSDKYSLYWIESTTFKNRRSGFIYRNGTIKNPKFKALFSEVFDENRELESYPGQKGKKLWEYGQLPFILSADVNIGESQYSASFVNVQAVTGENDDKNRLTDFRMMLDTLERYYPYNPRVVMGNFQETMIPGKSLYESLEKRKEDKVLTQNLSGTYHLLAKGDLTKDFMYATSSRVSLDSLEDVTVHPVVVGTFRPSRRRKQQLRFRSKREFQYGEELSLKATSDAKLPVRFRVLRGKGEISGGKMKAYGAGDIVLQLLQKGDKRRQGCSKLITLNVDKAPLKVSAKDAVKNYGHTNPSFRVRYDGFVNDDGPEDLDGHLHFRVLAREFIRPSGLQSEDYDISYADGRLKVNVVPLTVTVRDTVRMKDDPLPDFKVDYEGFVNGDGPEVLEGKLEFKVKRGEVFASGLTSAYYVINYVPGVLHTVHANPDDLASFLSFEPNPAKDELVFSLKEYGEVDVVFYNIAGKEEMSVTVRDGEVIDISELPSGMYLLMVKVDGKNVAVKKLNVYKEI